MPPEKALLIVDDHPLFREGLKSIIGRDARYHVVGEAGTGKEAIRMAKALKPDLVLMDISLPDRSGIDVTREIRALLPDAYVVIISMHSKIDYIAEAFRAGATGYVVKESASDRLLNGLDAVSRGELFLDSSVSHKVITMLMDTPIGETKITDGAYETLTPREQEVMRLLAEGVPVRKIAEKLFISPKTVENHRANIMTKLGIQTTHELVRYAARLGLIDVDLWKN